VFLGDNELVYTSFYCLSLWFQFGFTNIGYDFFMNYTNLVNIIIASIAALSAVASAWAAYTLNTMQENQREFDEKLTAIRALADWSKARTDTARHCAEMLSHLNKMRFAEAVRTRKFPLKMEYEDVAKRCFSAYVKPVSFEGVMDDDQRLYVAQQLIDQLNNYEALSLYWSEMGPDAKKIICQQANLDKASPYRAFKEIAQGTEWWRFPRLEDFMAGCSS
jgi:hypothetical protein